MAIKNSKISAVWKLEVRSTTDNSILRTYQFPDVFLDNFFDAANGWAAWPLGRVGETAIKWGYGTTPVTFLDKRLVSPAQLPARYDGILPKERRWPVWRSSDLIVQAVEVPGVGSVNDWVSGFISYDPETRTVIKRSGNVVTTQPDLDLNGNPLHSAWFEILATEVTAPITEFGTAVRYSYYDSGWLNNANKPTLITSEDPWDENETSRPGLDYFSGSMFHYSPAVNTRALVLDGDGNPTSIVLAVGEKLRVSRELKLEFTLFEPSTILTTTHFSGSTHMSHLTQEVPEPVVGDKSFWKVAPIEDLLALQRVMQYASPAVEYRSSDDLILGEGYIIPGWDDSTGTWKSFKFRTTNPEDRNSDQLNISLAATKDIKSIIIHEGNYLQQRPDLAEERIVILTSTFQIPIPLAGMDGVAFDYGFHFKRYVSRG